MTNAIETLTDSELDTAMMSALDASEAFAWMGGRTSPGPIPADVLARHSALLAEFDRRHPIA